MHTIYLVRKDSKPVYVGYTSRSVRHRWYEHIHDSKKRPKNPLHCAISKYGAKSFHVEILYESEDENHTKNFMEHHFIWLHKTNISNGGYNLTSGGEGNPRTRTEKEKKDRAKIWYETNKEKYKDRRRDYNKIWRNLNKDRNREMKKKYCEENKEKVSAYQKAYYESHKEQKRAYSNAYYKRKSIE